MRKVLVPLFVLLCMHTSGFAQKSSLDDFLGIKWGASQAEAKKIMLARSGTTLDKKNSDDEVLIFDGGEFAGSTVAFYMLSFTKEGFHTGRVYLKKTLAAKTLDQYRSFKKLLSEKYGTPEHDFFMFDSPYDESDDDSMLAIALKLGKGTVSSYWKFTTYRTVDEFQQKGDTVDLTKALKNVQDGVPENIISLSVDEDLYVVVGYQNGDLIKRAVGRKNEQKKGDL